LEGYAHKNKKRLMTLPVEEFLRRFLLHLLPKGFVRIRHFGFLATRQRTARLPICFRSLAAALAHGTPGATNAEAAAACWTCPQCGGSMQLIERLTAAQIHLRTPSGRGP
jgi:hypothetical protein